MACNKNNHLIGFHTFFTIAIAGPYMTVKEALQDTGSGKENALQIVGKRFGAISHVWM
jgi:hypothetical protein